MDKFDYVIVGAGSAGATLAARLSENPKTRVAVIEAGGSDLNFWIRMPIGYGVAFSHPGINWKYQTEPVPGTTGQPAYFPRGKVIGGSSSINAMVFVRGQAADYDGWAADGCTGWTYDDVLPVFKRMENNLAGADDYRGTEGPLTVSHIGDSVHPLSHDYVASAVNAGLPLNPDYNGASQEGVNLYQLTTRNGFRCSTATAYLNPARKRQNLTVISKAHARKVLFDGKRAIGVEYQQGRKIKRAMAEAEVILSAGAIGSPQLLQLSGIGDADHLRGLGIEPLHHAPQVGQNMQDHIGYDYVYEANVPTLNNILRPWWGRIKVGLQYVLTRKGPLSLSVNQGGGFFRSSPDRDRPNLQLYFTPLSYTRMVPGTRKMMSPDPFAGMLISISNCYPYSRGHLAIRSADPFDHPEIHPGYLSDERDLDELLEGADMLRKIMASEPMASKVAREVTPGLDVTDRDAMREDIRGRTGSIYHPSCTCAMGVDPASSVVDPQLRVHGVQGLRVADASIFPNIPAGNINGPSIMVGERAFDFISKEHG